MRNIVQIFIGILAVVGGIWCGWALARVFLPESKERPLPEFIGPVNPRDYQMDVQIDSTTLWDGERNVGTVPNTWKTPLDSLIMEDNQ